MDYSLHLNRWHYQRPDWLAAVVAGLAGGAVLMVVTHGVAFTCGRMLFYAGLVWAVSLLPYALGIGYGLYVAGACMLGARFVERAWRLRGDERLAMPTFRYSIVYLAVLFGLLLLDYWLSGVP